MSNTYRYEDLNDFYSSDRARESVISNLNKLHADFCACILAKIAQNIFECKTYLYAENYDDRISPFHFIIQEFMQKLKEKGYGIEIRQKGSNGMESIKAITIDWGTKEKQ